MFEIGELFTVLIITAMGGFIQRVTGFGFGIFVMLFFPHMMETHTSAAAISSLVSCCITLYNAILYRKHIPYKKIMPLILSAIVTIPVAVRFSVLVSGDIFNKILGIVLIGLSLYFLFFNNRVALNPSVKNSLISGGISGVLTGLFSTGGPPVIIYLMNAFKDNFIYFVSTQFYFGTTELFSTIVRAFNGIITLEIIVCSAVGFLGSITGNFVGKHIFDKLNAQRLRQLIYIGMIVSGIIMIV